MNSIFLPADQFTAADDRVNWKQLGNVAAVNRDNNVFDFTMDAGPAPRLIILSPSVFRVRFNAASNYGTDFSYAVLPQPPAALLLTTKEDALSLIIDTGAITVQVFKQPFAVTVLNEYGDQICADSGRGVVYVDESVANFKALANGAFYYGFGEKAGPTLDKRGKSMTFFNFDNFSYPTDDKEAMYVSIPLLIECNPAAPKPYCYGLFLDNPSQTYFDVGQRIPGQYYLGAVYGDLNYYFLFGPSLGEVIERYTGLTGRMPLPPKYVLGYHQGCYGYDVDVGTGGLGSFRQNILKVASNYRKNKIPCDGLHIDVDFQVNYRMFTAGSSPDRPEVSFGDPKTLLDKLRQQGFKCSTNITPMIKNDGASPNAYTTRDEGFADGVFLSDPRTGDFYKGFVDYGTDPLRNNEQLGAEGFYPDLTLPKAQLWWGRQYAFLFQTGLEMVWQDMTDPAIATEHWGAPTDHKTLYGGVMQYDFGRNTTHVKIHNAYAQSMLHATSGGIDTLRPGKRNFIIARGGYAGLQRYAGAWTGDSSSDWAHYQVNIPMVLGLGLSGVPISGCDIGGFANGPVLPGQKVDNELLVRWMTLGSFLPWYRNHYDAYSKAVQEPYSYPEAAEVLTICRKYIELRYRLLQYFYDALWISHLTGLPIARPLSLTYPADVKSYERTASSQQFMVADSLLVAPVLQQGSLGRTVYVPAGNDWYLLDLDGKLDKPFKGGTTWLQPAGLEDVPAYVRAGAIIPLREVEQFVGEREQNNKLNPLTVQVWPGPDRTYRLFLDDGLTTDYKQGKYRETEIAATTSGNQRTILFTRKTDGFKPPEPFFFVRLLQVSPQSPKAVTVNGTVAAPTVNAAALDAAAGNAYFLDTATAQVCVKVFDADATITVQASF
jgi:alpha-glucosidase